MVQSLPYKIRSQTNRSLFFISQKKKQEKNNNHFTEKIHAEKTNYFKFHRQAYIIIAYNSNLSILKLNWPLFKSRILYLHL